MLEGLLVNEEDPRVAQGLLPPKVLSKAVDENFIAPRLAELTAVSQQ